LKELIIIVGGEDACRSTSPVFIKPRRTPRNL